MSTLARIQPDRDRPRVLVISAAFPPMIAGEAGHAWHLCHRLAERGLDLHLLTTDRPGTPKDLPFRVHADMPGWRWRDLPRLQATIRTLQPDAILLIYTGWNYGYHPMITFASTTAKFVAPHARFVTQVEHPGGANPATLPLSARAMTRVMRQRFGAGGDYAFGTLLRDSDAVIGLADHHVDALLEHGADPARITVLPPPPLITEANHPARTRRDARAELKIAPHETLLAYTGLIAPGKGVETLLESVANHARTRGGLRLALIGGIVNEQLDHETYVDALHRRVEQLGLTDRVHWTGSFGYEDPIASRWLHAADVAVLPWDTGVHMNNSSVANAASHGLPVVTTRPDRLEPIFADGENLLLVPPRDPAALGAAIDRVCRESVLRRRLSRGATDLARDWFGWDRVLDETLRQLRVKEEIESELRRSA